MHGPDRSIDGRTRRALLRAGGLAALSALAGCAGQLGGAGDSGDDGTTTDGTPTGGGGIDDWQYEPPEKKAKSGAGGNASATVAQAAPTNGAADAGFAAGGAKDATTFRRNVEEGFLPIPESLSYEGLFYDYYFETGGSGDCSQLFCPRYSPAVSPDPLSGETERYLTVGLDSGLAPSEFERKKLNLVVVLDVSGSMNSPFDRYYYDQYGNRREVEDGGDDPKIDVATEAVADMTTHLNADDRFGMVTFNDGSQVAKPLRKVGETDMAAIREHIREDVVAGGGTRLSAGIGDATEMLSGYGEDVTEYETRTVVVTDAMPNLGTTDEGGLRGTLEENAEGNLHTTFVGVGVDFHAGLVDSITSIRGANYYSVHSKQEFEQRLDEEFEYMVTPLVFDLSVELDGEGHELQRVYGTSAAEESTGQVLYANTLFPSPTSEGKTRGGVILAKVERTAADPGSLELTASWEDRRGRTDSTTATVTFPEGPESFANSGVRKAVLLSRYADLLKSWMIDTREREGEPKTDGVRVPREVGLGEWEQQSRDLQVPDPYRQRFRTFADHFEREMDALGDGDLQQELEILRELANHGGGSRVVGSGIPGL